MAWPLVVLLTEEPVDVLLDVEEDLPEDVVVLRVVVGDVVVGVGVGVGVDDVALGPPEDVFSEETPVGSKETSMASGPEAQRADGEVSAMARTPKVSPDSAKTNPPMKSSRTDTWRVRDLSSDAPPVADSPRYPDTRTPYGSDRSSSPGGRYPTTAT
jgi:hypothetical protein